MIWGGSGGLPVRLKLKSKLLGLNVTHLANNRIKEPIEIHKKTIYDIQVAN